MADELVSWLGWSLDQYMAAAEEALSRGDYQEAADLLTVVLSIDPRTPRAAHLLARAQAPLR
jgi:Tfp pilus assembly protein PilF